MALHGVTTHTFDAFGSQLSCGVLDRPTGGDRARMTPRGGGPGRPIGPGAWGVAPRWWRATPTGSTP